MPNRYWVSGGNGLWNSTTNWATASGGPSGTAIPIAADDVFFNVFSTASCNVNVAATMKTIDFTGYTYAVTMSNSMTVAGNVTLTSSMGITGSSGFIVNTTGTTLKSNGRRWDRPITINLNGGTFNFSDNWYITTFTTNFVGGNALIFNSSSVYISQDLVNNQTQNASTGTTNFILAGSGSWSGTALFGHNLEISSSITAISGSPQFGNSKTLKYTTGSLITSGSTLTMGTGIFATFDLQNSTWNNLSVGANGAVTLLSDCNFNDVTLGAVAAGTGVNINGLFNLNIRGSLTNNQTIGGISGTSTILFAGTGSWGGAASILNNNVTINTTSSITLGANITWGTTGRTFTLTAGSMNPGTTTFSIPNSANVTINGGTFYNLTIPGSSTSSINTPVTITNNLTLGTAGSLLFTGSAGWTCANLICSTTNTRITLANSSSGASYRTTTNANLLGTATLPIIMTSDNATTRSLWTLNNGAQQSLTYVSGTRIDSSQGQTIYTFGSIGSLTDTVNWATGSRPGTVSYTFVN